MKKLYTFILLSLCIHARSNAHSGELISAKMADFRALILATKNQITTHLQALKKAYFGYAIPSEIQPTIEEKPTPQISIDPENQERTLAFKKARYYGVYPKTRQTKSFYHEKQLRAIKEIPRSIFTDKNKLARPSLSEEKQDISSHQNFPKKKQNITPTEASVQIDIDFAPLSIDQLDHRIKMHESEYCSKAHGTRLKGASLENGETFPYDIAFQTSKSFRFIDKETGKYQTQLYRMRIMLESKNPVLEKIGKRLDEMAALLREKLHKKEQAQAK